MGPFLMGYKDSNVGSGSSTLYDILTYATPKNIFLFWISDKLAQTCPGTEYLSSLLHSKKGQFIGGPAVALVHGGLIWDLFSFFFLLFLASLVKF